MANKGSRNCDKVIVQQVVLLRKGDEGNDKQEKHNNDADDEDNGEEKGQDACNAPKWTCYTIHIPYIIA